MKRVLLYIFLAFWCVDTTHLMKMYGNDETIQASSADTEEGKKDKDQEDLKPIEPKESWVCFFLDSVTAHPFSFTDLPYHFRGKDISSPPPENLL